MTELFIATELYVKNIDDLKISIRHVTAKREKVIIIAPGFFTSKDTKTYRGIEKDLSRSFDVISMDFRGHGKSQGFYTYSANEKEDLKAVVDYAKSYGYKKIGVLGFSYGGAIAMVQTAEYKNIDSLVCVGSPMASEEIEFKWWTPEAFKLGILKFEWGNGVRPGNPFLKKVRSIDIVKFISPTPIFFIHGTGDPTVDQRHSQMLYEAANELKAIKLFENGSHAEEIYRRYPVDFVHVILSWFNSTL